MAKAKQKQLRQGDVLIRRVRGKAKGQPVQPRDGQLVLAEGEATGHAHTVDARCGTLSLDEGGLMFLTIEELTEVRHQEHAPITLEPGVYRVTRQREYTPDAIRNVAD